MAKNFRKGINSLHGFYNNTVYDLLKQYKNPKPYMSETGITCHLLNILNSKQNRKIKYFGKIGPEKFTGSDLLLILRGTYYGKKKELRILYQAKLTSWLQNTPYIFLDNRIKASSADFQNKMRLDAFISQLRKYGIDIEGRKIIRSDYDMYQHDCLLSFANAIGAESLYLLYRYIHNLKIKKDKSVGFAFARIIKRKVDKSSNFTIKEDDLGNGFFFHNTVKPHTAILQNLRNDSGFYFFQSNFEAAYEGYVKLFEDGCRSLDLSNLEAVNLYDQNSIFSLVSDFKESDLHNLYASNGNVYRLEFESKIEDELKPHFPMGVCVIDMD